MDDEPDERLAQTRSRNNDIRREDPMICPKCGTENDDTRTICTNCGQFLATRTRNWQPLTPEQKRKERANKARSILRLIGISLIVLIATLLLILIIGLIGGQILPDSPIFDTIETLT